MFVGEVCNREVVTIDAGASMMEVIGLMRKHHVGDVVVVDESGGRTVPKGIITDRDIVIELLAIEIALDSVSVGDAMSYELMTAREEDGIFETLTRMRDKGIRRMPVVNSEGALKGILTVDDLVELFAEQLSDVVKLICHQQQRERTKRP